MPPMTRAPITKEGPTFPPMASTLMLFLGAAGVPAPMQSAAMPPMAPMQSATMTTMAGAPLLSQNMPGAYMASAAWPMYMPRPRMEPFFTQSKRELLAI